MTILRICKYELLCLYFTLNASAGFTNSQVLLGLCALKCAAVFTIKYSIAPAISKRYRCWVLATFLASLAFLQIVEYYLVCVH